VIITLILILVVAAIVGAGFTLAVRARREFRQQNEVVPGVPSAAPASWAGAHSPEARLHRRLRDAVAAAHRAAKVSGVDIDAATARIDVEAAALDDRLVAAAALPASHRAAAVERLDPLVASLEGTVASLVDRVFDSTGPRELLEQSLDEADIALEALARARAEVEQLDRIQRDMPLDPSTDDRPNTENDNDTGTRHPDAP
jgi:hypothetical protein